jgi:uncharacterized protein (TIGR02466 family)
MSGKKAKRERKEAKENESEKEKLERLAKNTEMKLLKPFGPFVGMFSMPSEITQALIDKTNEVLEDRNRIDWGKNLVGQIAEEPWISNEDLDEIGALKYLEGMLYNYVWNALTGDGHELEALECNLDHAWIVSQYENEYNPIHFHTYCDLSSVLYLKVPPFDDRSKTGNLPEYKFQRDGMIEFVYKTACPTGLEKGSMSFMPEPGKLVVFPSNLLHTVYPFKGEGERRSIAFNSHWQARLKGGKLFDKSFRMKSDQKHEEYQKTLTSKGKDSGFAKRKQGSFDSGASEEENKI